MRNNGHGPVLFNIPLFLAGAALGSSFADIDQIKITPFLDHRSILTHGMLLPLLLLYLVRRQSAAMGTGLRLFTIGFSLANAVHLAFDLFPSLWYKHALIHIPCCGWTPAWFSILWIVSGIVMSLYIVFLLIRDMSELALSAVAIFVVFLIAAAAERQIALAAGVTLMISTLIALALSGHSSPERIVIEEPDAL